MDHGSRKRSVTDMEFEGARQCDSPSKRSPCDVNQSHMPHSSPEANLSIKKEEVEDRPVSPSQDSHNVTKRPVTSYQIEKSEDGLIITSGRANNEKPGGEELGSNSRSVSSAVENQPHHHVQDERMDGLDHFILMQKMKGADPAILLKDVADQLGLTLNLPSYLPQEVQWSLLRRIMFEPLMKFRQKLDHVNVLDDVVNLIRRSRRIMVLTGAGISVACGIPDFRSENGIYARLGHFNLPDPQAMFDINFFRRNPVPFFTFSKELLPGTYRPSVSHLFIRQLEQQSRLLRCYTQNIDSLELVAGLPSDRLLQCHGSFETATCLYCKAKYVLDDIRQQILDQQVPMCMSCGHQEGVIKPDIVFFGETLGDRFPKMIEHDKRRVDLLLVMGSSLKVGPVNKIMQWLPERIPQILINRELVGQPNKFDVELLGNCDAIIMELCQRLGWTLPIEEAVHEGKTVPERRTEEGMKMEEAYEFEEPNRYFFVDAKKPMEENDQGENSDDDDEEEEEEAEEAEEGENGEDDTKVNDDDDDDEEEEEIERALLKRTLGGVVSGPAPSGAGDGASGGSSPTSASSSKNGDEEEEEEYELPGIEEDNVHVHDQSPSSSASSSQPTEETLLPSHMTAASPMGSVTVASSQGSISRPSSALAFSSPQWGTPAFGPKAPSNFSLDHMLELP